MLAVFFVCHKKGAYSSRANSPKYEKRVLVLSLLQNNFTVYMYIFVHVFKYTLSTLL